MRKFRGFWWAVCSTCGLFVLTETPRVGAQTAVWPLSGTATPNTIVDPYGPRWIGSYDFHAGIDMPAAKGTPVKAVLPGTVVDVRTWDGVTVGGGNEVLVAHANNEFTAYLHLDTIGVTTGEVLSQGEELGTVGSTGATFNHLHLTYMLNLPSDSVDERKSHNPLELLPHTAVTSLPPATFVDGSSVRLSVPLEDMTIKSITLSNGSQSRTVDYYSVVAEGSVARNDQLQNGIHIDADDATGGFFPLTLALSPADFAVTKVTVTDFNGQTILSQSVPEPMCLGGVLMVGIGGLCRRPRRR